MFSIIFFICYLVILLLLLLNDEENFITVQYIVYCIFAVVPLFFDVGTYIRLISLISVILIGIILIQKWRGIER